MFFADTTSGFSFSKVNGSPDCTIKLCTLCMGTDVMKLEVQFVLHPQHYCYVCIMSACICADNYIPMSKQQHVYSLCRLKKFARRSCCDQYEAPTDSIF